MANSDDKIRILIITGPTASGKSNLAIHAAEKYSGEIISCDSMQIYTGMDIGTAKPSKAEMDRIPHHMIDVVEPSEDFSAARYAKMAKAIIEDVHDRSMLPIICGGTGLYLDGILYDMDYGSGPADEGMRSELEERVKKEGALPLYEELRRLDPEAASNIHPNNVKRLIRALERIYLGEEKIRSFRESHREDPRIDPLLIGLKMPREELYERINRRVDRMMEEGLVREVERLRDSGLSRDNASMLAIGYKEVLSYLEGETDLDETVDLIKSGTRHYAKRQFTWFKRYDKMIWLDVGTDTSEEDVAEKLDAVIEEQWQKRP